MEGSSYLNVSNNCTEKKKYKSNCKVNCSLVMYWSSWMGFFLTSKWRLKPSICKTRIDLCQHHAELDLLRILVCVCVFKVKKEEEEGRFYYVREDLPAMGSSFLCLPHTTMPKSYLPYWQLWTPGVFTNSFQILTEIFLHSTSVEGMDSASLSDKSWDQARRKRDREREEEHTVGRNWKILKRMTFYLQCIILGGGQERPM